MADNPFNTPTSGQADWDSGLSYNFGVIERGYHVTERAGQAVSTGQIVACTSGGFLLPFDPNSNLPPIGWSFTAAASGDSLSVLGWGIVRSLGISSVAVGGALMFSNRSGFLSTTTLGPAVGIGLIGYGLLFNPAKFNPASLVAATALAALTDVNTNGVSNGKALIWQDASSKWVPGAPGASALAALTDVNTTGVGSGTSLVWSNASSKWVVGQPYVRGHRVQSVQVAVVVGSLHTFTMSLAALFGWNRRVRMNGSSASYAEIKFYSDSARTDLQYQTLSGGVSGVTSFHDRAGWPVDAESGTIYGTVKCFSLDVASDTLNIICDWEA